MTMDPVGLFQQWPTFCMTLKEHIALESSSKYIVTNGSVLLFAGSSQLDAIDLMASELGLEFSKLVNLVELIEKNCLPNLIHLYELFKHCYIDADNGAGDALVKALSQLFKKVYHDGKENRLTRTGIESRIESNGEAVVSIEGDKSNLEEGNIVPENLESMVKEELGSETLNEDEMDDDKEDTEEVKSEEIKKKSDSPRGPKYHCQECYRPFLRLHRLESHRLKKHSVMTKAAKHLCKLCGHSFSSVPGLSGHISRKHPSKKKNLCKNCGKYFENVSECRKHVQEHKVEREKPRHKGKRKISQKKVESQKDKFHIKQCLRKEQKTKTRSRKPSNCENQVEYICGKCEDVFRLKDALQSHIIDKHSVEKELICDQCGMFFDTSEKCIEHVQSHSTEGKNSKEAQVSQKTIGTKDEIRELTEQLHGEQVVQVESSKDPNIEIHCHLCRRRFYTLCSLQRHILRNHHDEKDRLCRYCGQVFKNAEECSSHVRVHIAQNRKSREVLKQPAGLVNGRYSCQLCGRTFRLAATLRCHRLRAHPLEKDRICPRCGKYFETEEACTRHRRLHVEKNLHGKNRARSITNFLQGPKVIKCHLCHATFYVRGGIKNHIQRKHPVERHRICGYCGKYFSSINECRTHVRLHVIERRQLRDFHQEKIQLSSNQKSASQDSASNSNSNSKESIVSNEDTQVGSQEKSVGCQACGREYKLLSSFRRHISRYHPQIQDRLCHHCGVVLEDATVCKLHLESEHSQPQINVGENPLTLPDGFEQPNLKETKQYTRGKLFLKGKKFGKISEDADGTIPAGYMKCGLCPSILGSRSSMRDHIKSIHNKFQDHVCSCCGKYFDDSAKCLEHQQSSKKSASGSEDEGQSIPPGYIKCGLCTSVLGSRKSMRDHIRSLHFKQKEHMCTCCGKYFENPADRDEHQKPTMNLSCDFCNKTFKTQLARDSHMKRHVNQRDFQCDICGNCYFDKKGLNAHRERHEAQAKNMFQCAQCEKILSSRKNLEIHMRIHNNERPYICEICGKGFTLVSTMKIHRNIHSGIKPYECEVCGKKARTKGDLGRHMSLHSDKKEFVCDICGKSYRFQTGLNQHRAVHSGLRPHVCKICGCTYKTSNDLRKHMKTHKPGAKTKGTTVPRVSVPNVPNEEQPHPIYNTPSVVVPSQSIQQHQSMPPQLPPPLSVSQPHLGHPREIPIPPSSHPHHNPDNMTVLPSRLNNTYTSEEMAVVMALQVLDDMSSAVEPAVYGGNPQAIRRYEPNVPNYPGPPGVRRYDGGVANYPGPSSFRRYDGSAPHYP